MVWTVHFDWRVMVKPQKSVKFSGFCFCFLDFFFYSGYLKDLVQLVCFSHTNVTSERIYPNQQQIYMYETNRSIYNSL